MIRRVAFLGVVPHLGGTYTVFLNLRRGLQRHGIELRWLSAGKKDVPRQVDRVQPGVHRTADLFDADPIDRGVVVLLTHAGTEEVAQLSHEEVPPDAPPAANFVVVHAQFFLGLAETVFD